MSTRYAYGRFITVEAFLADDGCDCTNLDSIEDATLVADALDFASDQLARLSGMRFRGQRTVTDWRPRLSCDTCGTRCITLPADAILPITIRQDGVTLAEDTDWVRSGLKLFRLNAEGRSTSWGRQDILLPLTEPDTLGISFIQGAPTTWLEKAAVIEGACDAIKAWTGGAQPLLRDVSSISGGGVSITVPPGDDEDPIAETMPSVARFVAFWNPHGQSLPNEVFSPDLGTECGIRSCW